MKHELDDFLKEKEEEFNVPFEEKYWERASAFMESERKRYIFGKLTGGNVAMLVVACLLFIGTSSYFIFKPGTVTTQSNTVAVASPAATITTNSNESKSGNTSTPTNTTSDSNTGNNSSINGINNTKGTPADVSPVITPVKKDSDHRVAGNTTSVKKSFTNAASEKTAPVTNNIITSRIKGNSPGKNVSQDENTVRDNVDKTTNTVPVVANRNNETGLTIIGAERPLQVSYHVESLTPALLVLTNDFNENKILSDFLRSEGSSSSKKIRELKYGAQYPQLNVTMQGGFNFFNHYKKNNNLDPLISTNPFLGLKVSYQWRPEWFAQAQLNFVQRGAVNLNVPANKLSGQELAATEVYRVRHLYYVQLPVLIGYQLSKKNTVTAGLGVSYLVKEGAQVKDDTTGNYTGSYKLENRGGFNKVDVFVMAGYTYRLNRKVSFSLTGSYGLLDVTKNTFFGENVSHHNMNLGLSIGYTLLQKKIMAR